MKSADLIIGEEYAYCSSVRRTVYEGGRRTRLATLGDQTAVKAKVLRKGVDKTHPRGYPAYIKNGIEIEFQPYGESETRIEIVRGQNIIATWSDYQTAVEEMEAYKRRQQDFRASQKREDRARKKIIADALVARGLTNGIHGDFHYDEHRDGSTTLDVPMTAVAQLLGVREAYEKAGESC